jgi:hypothetical protein
MMGQRDQGSQIDNLRVLLRQKKGKCGVVGWGWVGWGYGVDVRRQFNAKDGVGTAAGQKLMERGNCRFLERR